MNFSFAQRRLIFFGALSLGAITHAEDAWVTLRDCRYLPNPANDGDSFHVQTPGQEYIFRLYFVDTPETDASLPERVAEQAKYFGVTISQALQIGREAKRFTREELSHSFTVRTCKQDARGRSRMPRYFAFVVTDSADLGEVLVANGLARVYGAASEAHDMITPEVEWRKLEQLEQKAKAQKLGGWGIGAGRLNTRAVAWPSTGANSFDAFFHSNPVQPAATSTSKKFSLGAKLDVNGASIETLQDIPGVGLILAARIIAARPFKSADELRGVKGIGPKKYAQFRPFFR